MVNCCSSVYGSSINLSKLLAETEEKASTYCIYVYNIYGRTVCANVPNPTPVIKVFNGEMGEYKINIRIYIIIASFAKKNALAVKESQNQGEKKLPIYYTAQNYTPRHTSQYIRQQ